MPTSKQPSHISEYNYFLNTYLCPLLSLKESVYSPKRKTIDERYKGKFIYQEENNTVCFTNKEYVISEVHYNKKLGEDTIKIADNIIDCFSCVSKFHLATGKKQADYYSDVHKETNYRMAIQKGICDWIIGGRNDKVERLFEILENWSVQTYEGKKVTFGFIIDPNKESSFDTKYGDWSDFLKDDFSAVLTDCVNSVIELDKNCNFSSYLSITENNMVEEYTLQKYLPLRFSNVIEKYVSGERVGIFLLNNGDIILSKKGRAIFVKRNLKWLNLEYDAFEKAFAEYFDKNPIVPGLLEEIFASMLDVSFSHSGGIIAVVNDERELTKHSENELPILSESDYLLNEKTLEQIYDNLTATKKYPNREVKKRILKRNVIQSLVKSKTFTELDRKLRCELISLDGACILNTKGQVCSFGAIIKNDSGSSGGGRGAAAKKLSHNGFAIKISTDGYIELYINERKEYSIK